MGDAHAPVLALGTAPPATVGAQAAEAGAAAFDTPAAKSAYNPVVTINQKTFRRLKSPRDLYRKLVSSRSGTGTNE